MVPGGQEICLSQNFNLNLYLIETPFNAFANRVYSDQAALVRAT